MTCLVGLINRGTVYVGADSQMTTGWTAETMAAPKVFRLGAMLLAVTGTVRLCNVVRYRFVPPPHHPPEQDTDEYLATSFADGLRSCLGEHGVRETIEGIERIGKDDTGGGLLVGYRGGLYHLSSNFSVSQSTAPYMALGSGKDFALGALFASEGQPPRDRVRLALEAAERFNIGVGGPFVIEEQAA